MFILPNWRWLKCFVSSCDDASNLFWLIHRTRQNLCTHTVLWTVRQWLTSNGILNAFQAEFVVKPGCLSCHPTNSTYNLEYCIIFQLAYDSNGFVNVTECQQNRHRLVKLVSTVSTYQHRTLEFPRWFSAAACHVAAASRQVCLFSSSPDLAGSREKHTFIN